MRDYYSVNPDYPIPDWFYEGQTVYAPYPEKDTHIKCIVVAAHGDCARVVNEKYGFDKIINRYLLRVSKEEYEKQKI